MGTGEQPQVAPGPDHSETRAVVCEDAEQAVKPVLSKYPVCSQHSEWLIVFMVAKQCIPPALVG